MSARWGTRLLSQKPPSALHAVRARLQGSPRQAAAPLPCTPQVITQGCGSLCVFVTSRQLRHMLLRHLPSSPQSQAMPLTSLILHTQRAEAIQHTWLPQVWFGFGLGGLAGSRDLCRYGGASAVTGNMQRGQPSPCSAAHHGMWCDTAHPGCPAARRRPCQSPPPWGWRWRSRCGTPWGSPAPP